MKFSSYIIISNHVSLWKITITKKTSSQSIARTGFIYLSQSIASLAIRTLLVRMVLVNFVNMFQEIDEIKTFLESELKTILKTDSPVLLETPVEKARGDFTLKTFALAKELKQNPIELGKLIQNQLKTDFLEKIEVTGGYVNFFLKNEILNQLVLEKILLEKEVYGKSDQFHGQTVMVEYSSPNTNKPLHLGHIRNNLLGMSLANLFEFVGYKVIKAQIINDRGIHICKSMLGYQKWGQGETPETTGLKGDHLVAKYYVLFETALKEEKKQYFQEHKIELIKLSEQAQRQTELDFLKQSGLYQEAQNLLQKWEQDDPETLKLWQTMNSWVYAGWEKTYQELGSRFDKNYYESELYEEGKKFVEEGLQKGIFQKEPDGSVQCDLTDLAKNLGKKTLLRSDGTTVYITQDLALTYHKFKEFNLNKAIWVVANEQTHHFHTLFALMRKLGFTEIADHSYHLAYGMVALPTGKMKSREGIVVDADDLMEEVKNKAKQITQALKNYTPQELETISHEVGLGALKYQLLSVNPLTNVVFNPAESIAFEGNTGPFVQYTAARIHSLKQKAEAEDIKTTGKLDYSSLNRPKEKIVIQLLAEFPTVILSAAERFNPAQLTHYVYELAKEFNRFYQKHSVLSAETEKLKQARLALCQAVEIVIQKSLTLLGIETPEKM